MWVSVDELDFECVETRQKLDWVAWMVFMFRRVAFMIFLFLYVLFMCVALRFLLVFGGGLSASFSCEG